MPSPFPYFRRLDLTLLITLAVLALGAWAFVAITDEVLEGDTNTFDNAVLRALRRPDDPTVPIGPTWLHTTAAELTSLGSTTNLVLLTAFTVGLLVLERKRHAALLVALATAGALLCSTALKYAIARDRPDVVPHLTTFRQPSFPSGHAMIASAVYLTLAAVVAPTRPRRRVKAYVIAAAATLAVLVGLTRVYLGVHYPTDVLAGWTAGTLWATACWMVARALQRRGKVEHPTEPDMKPIAQPPQAAERTPPPQRGGGL